MVNSGTQIEDMDLPSSQNEAITMVNDYQISTPR
jgi:hypothetical protein